MPETLTIYISRKTFLQFSPKYWCIVVNLKHQDLKNVVNFSNVYMTKERCSVKNKLKQKKEFHTIFQMNIIQLYLLLY